MRHVLPVYRSLDGWEQRDDYHDNDTWECRAKKLEGRASSTAEADAAAVCLGDHRGP